MNTGVLLLIVFLLMILFRIPVSVALLMSTLAAALYADVSIIVLVKEFWSELTGYTLLAIPLFMLAGSLMESGGVTKRMANFANSAVGHLPGALGHVVILCNMLLAGVSGSGAADAVAVGGMFIPAMKEEKYPDELCAAVNAASATMGPIIPPSTIMVMYAACSGLSTGAMFLAGVIPGIIVGLTQMLIVYFYAKKHGIVSTRQSASFKEKFRAFLSCLPAILVPVIIIAGIALGFFTATEASMVACVYCILVCFFIYKSLRPKDLFLIFIKAAKSAAPCLFCVGTAGAFCWMMSYLGIPAQLTAFLLPLIKNTTGMLLLLVGVFIIVGMFMDPLPAIVIFYPMINSMAQAVGAPPMHVAIVVNLMLCFGLMTPPYGLTLLISSQIAKVHVLKTAKVLIPFYVVFVCIVIVVIFLPEVALFLPKLLMPTSFT